MIKQQKTAPSRAVHTAGTRINTTVSACMQRGEYAVFTGQPRRPQPGRAGSPE